MCVSVNIYIYEMKQVALSRQLWDFPRVLSSSQICLITLRSLSNIYFSHVGLICAQADKGLPHLIARVLQGLFLFINHLPKVFSHSKYNLIALGCIFECTMSSASSVTLKIFSFDLISVPWAMLLYLNVLDIFSIPYVAIHSLYIRAGHVSALLLR